MVSPDYTTAVTPKTGLVADLPVHEGFPIDSVLGGWNISRNRILRKVLDDWKIIECGRLRPAH